MKTAISIDDGLLREVDLTARRMGMSRSGLFALAVGDFLRQKRQDAMLSKLNEVYAGGAEQDRVLAKRIKARVRPTVNDRW